MMNEKIQIGLLLRSGTTGCVVGCRVNQLEAPVFGGMVRVPLPGAEGDAVYGLIYDIHIDDDGLVRQLVTAREISEEVRKDNRENRNMPVEMSVLFIGYVQSGEIFHLLPPRPPLSLDSIYLCQPAEMCAFTRAGRFGYFRHVLRAADLPTGELLAAHLRQVSAAHAACGDPAWAGAAARELITLLRDDYPALMAVLGAVSDAHLDFSQPQEQGR